MRCETFKSKLDAYIDGELNEREIGEMIGHANHCAACAEELHLAETLRNALNHMDEETDVPLQAQAAWRDAVRREAGKRAAKRRLRVVYAAAAAVVVLLGCTAVLKTNAPQKDLALEMAAEMPAATASVAIASDGIEAQSASECTARRKMRAADLAAAQETLAALCEEYGANIAYERASDGAWICGVALSPDSMEDFLNAAGQIGTTTETEILEEAPETALIEFQIQEDQT